MHLAAPLGILPPALMATSTTKLVILFMVAMPILVQVGARRPSAIRHLGQRVTAAAGIPHALATAALEATAAVIPGAVSVRFAISPHLSQTPTI